MAVIDPKKLLPPSNKSENSEKFLVPVSSIVLKKNVAISSRLLKPEAPKDEGKGGAIVPSKLVDKIVKVESILKSNLASQISQQNKKEREQKQKEAEEREKKLEIKPDKKGKVPLPSLPRIGFLDALRNYFINTLLGFIAVKLFDMAPKLIKFLDAIKPVAGFIGEFAGNLFNGLVEFVDKGYKAYDQVQKFVKSVGGENAEKLFNDFSKNLNTLLNGAIIAATIAISTAPKRPGGVSGGAGAGVSGVLERGSLSRLNESYSRYIAGKANIGDRARLLRRGFIGGRQALTKGGTEALAKGAARNAAQTAATQGAKQSARFAITKAPIIGALIGFIIDTVIFREKPTRAAAGAVGNAIGSAVGAGLLGGGTFGLGAGVGLFVGGWVGDWIGKALYDTITGYKPEPVQGKAQGGVVSSGRGKTPPRRGIKVQRAKPRRIVTQKTQPGKDIGGVKKIEELYGEDKPGTRSALRALKKSSEDVKRMRSLNGLSGAMFGAGIDMALGQKPDKNLSASLGSMFGAVIQTAIDSELNNTFGDITKTIAMAGGGVVPSRELKSNMSIGERIGRYISSALAVSIESSAAKILQNLNKELRLEGGRPMDNPTGPRPSISDDGSIPIEVSPDEVIGKVGSTGESLGPHIHIEDLSTPGAPIPNGVKSSILVEGKPMTSGTMVSGISPNRWGRPHNGEDWDQDWENKPISLTGGLKFVKYVPMGSDSRFAGYGNVAIIESPNRKRYFLAHLNAGPSNLQALQQRQQTQANKQVQQMRTTGNSISGQASWYGPSFDGNPTSVPGEIFDQNKLTAAMSRPGWNPNPGGAYWAEVTNTANNKKVRVKINDSGPYEPDLKTPHKTRVIDLSKAAFAKIASLSSGVINVRVEKLGAAPKTSSPPKQEPPTPKPALQNKGVVYDPATGKFIQKGGGFLGTNQEINVTNEQNIGLRESVKEFGLGTGNKEGEKKRAADGNYYEWKNGRWVLWNPAGLGANASLPKQTQSSTVATASFLNDQGDAFGDTNVIAYRQEYHYMYG